MKLIEQTSSIDWVDYFFLRLVTKTNENWSSLDQATLDYAMKLHEHLDIQDCVQENINNMQMEQINNQSKGRGF